MGTGQQRVTDMVGLANTSLVNSPPSQWKWTANLTIVLTCLETAKPFAESANTHMSHYMMQKDSCMTEFLCRKGKKKALARRNNIRNGSFNTPLQARLPATSYHVIYMFHSQTDLQE